MAKKPKVKNSAGSKDLIENNIGGLGEAMGIGGGVNPFGFPGNQGSPFTQPVSSSTPLFTNLRWYFVSNLRQVLSQIYVEIGLVQTIVDVPVDDALRGGI